MNAPYESTKRHPIRVVARRTGLSRDVLRAWELRYGAVEPLRSPGGQRLYSDADIERLRLLKEAIEAGRRIGHVAPLSTRELQALVREDERAVLEVLGTETTQDKPGSPERFLASGLDAVRAMNALELESILSRAAMSLKAADLLDHVITPLMTEIGDLWWEKQLTPAHERLATTVVRRVLDEVRGSAQSQHGPELVVATPSGQHHEVGAMLAATAAAAEGWRVTYLGPDLPAASIALAAAKTGARAVALSLIYPPSDPIVTRELQTLRKLLAAEVVIIAGGQAAGSYRQVLEEVGALWLPDGPALRSALDLLRMPRGNGNRADGWDN